jgi:uncharacterized SAM-binding protein YcdF (DUF218 family)
MFFPLAKVLWFLAQPSTLIAGALALGAVLWMTGRVRPGRTILIVGLAGLLVSGVSLVGDALIRPLETRFPPGDLSRDPRPVAGIIVLGGSTDSNERRELASLNEAAERLTEAVALARRLPSARLVFTGGSGALLAREAPEADAAARLLTGLGVAADRVTLENQSRDTHENAVFTRRLLGDTTGQRWLLVTSGWHMPRAVGCFRAAGMAVEAWPVDYRAAPTLDPRRIQYSIPEGLRRLDFVAREYAGLVMYSLTRRTDALFPAPR